MGNKRVNIADRLAELGHDPVINLVRIAGVAEASGNLALAAKVNSDLLEYTAPKLKMVEYEIGDNLADALMTPEQRRARIRELNAQVHVIPQVPIPPIEGSAERVHSVPAIQQEK